MDFKCPSCSRTVFNRRRKDCEFCGAAIPKELLRTDEEQAAIDAEYRDDSKRRRAAQRDRDAARDVEGGLDTFLFLGW
ncbi:MAG: hypothetical protein OER88_00945 [Planctomycetota bacterium]|nr:hypothetical protein [Planctomycetota bacterium]